MNSKTKPEKARKIAFLLSSLKFGGGERVVLNLAAALKETGYDVDILVMSKEGEFLTEAEINFSVIDLKCNKTWKLPYQLIIYLVKNRPDGLISSFWKLNICSCLARLFVPQVSLIVWEHSQPSLSKNSPVWLYAPSASLMYQLATRVVAVSNGVSSDIKRITFGLKNKISVIFNPIPEPKSIELNTKLNGHSKIIIWVGRLDEPKNPFLMLDAFATIAKRLDCILWFVGDGPQREPIERRTQLLQLHERVYFLGFQANPYSYMQRADLLVSSSDREGLGNVIIEGLYCGLPIVSTDSGGVRDVLLNNVYGEIVPIGEKQALALAIEHKLATPKDPLKQKSGAQRFQPQVVAQQFIAALFQHS